MTNLNASFNAGDWDNARYNYHTNDNNVATTTQFCGVCGGWISGPIWMVNPKLCECIKYSFNRYPVRFPDPTPEDISIFMRDYLARENEILALRKEIKSLEREIELLKELLAEVRGKTAKPTK